jgi:uncharacterized protein YegP (UPF0339 family)
VRLGRPVEDGPKEDAGEVPDPASGTQYYFTVVARNGQTLCHSESYWDKADCRNAIRIIQGSAESAPVEDLA